MTNSGESAPWIDAERTRQRFTTQAMQLTDSGEWSLRDGVIAHNTGRFFELRGLEWTNARGARVCSPFISQPEVGILGIVMTSREGELSILLDAKFEPGNVYGVDVAPSFQATRSNFERAHGGNPPALSELFLTQENWHSHVRQSEQGTRFLQKWNENVIIREADELMPELATSMKWNTVDELRTLLRTSHVLNTDARSVIATSDWKLWLTPSSSSSSSSFSQESQVARAIRESLDEPARADLASHASHVLTTWETRNSFSAVEVPLVLDDGAVHVDSRARQTGTLVTHVQVDTDSRERDSWDQPLIGNPAVSEEVLLCAVDAQGIPRFFFTPTSEVGLAGAQFGTSLTTFDSGRSNPLVLTDPSVAALRDSGSLVASVSQSDEGGRFHRQLVTYSIRVIDDMSRASELAPEGQWFSPREICDLAQQSGFFTNEARSALSLVLGLS